MKESKLIQMQNQMETLGQVCMKMTRQIQALEMLAMGDHEVIKRLEEFPAIINQMQKEEQDAKENTNGSTTGDSGSTNTTE